MSSNTPQPPDYKDAARQLSAMLEERAGKQHRQARRAVTLVGAVVAVAVVGYLVWLWANQVAGVKREAPKISTIIPLPPPPPPPPPPPKPPEPEPPKEQPVEQPKPDLKPVEQPKPKADAPSPAKDLANPMQMHADAQAGSDAFNIGAGQGSGMAGSGGGGFGNATYGQYMSSVLQKILGEDEKTRHLVYRLNVNIWIDSGGRITRAELARSSGDADTDAKVLAALRAAPPIDERPPATLPMPVRASLNSRRPS